ncbi:MAG: hypothetical protein HXY41_17270 [Chloroflexi bacterium]|nr:hypothetical protein [Chloroflexota bacterium]
MKLAPFIFPMPLITISGDPLLSQMQTLGFGFNARAGMEVGALETRLIDRYPAAFSAYRKLCHSGRIKPGAIWIWRESRPYLAFLVIRESAQGSTRLRFLEAAMMALARDYRLYGLESLALTPLGSREEWPLLKPVVEYWLSACPLPVTLYEQYMPGVAGEDSR